jgi:hypothetical protein
MGMQAAAQSLGAVIERPLRHPYTGKLAVVS